MFDEAKQMAGLWLRWIKLEDPAIPQRRIIEPVLALQGQPIAQQRKHHRGLIAFHGPLCCTALVQTVQGDFSLAECRRTLLRREQARQVESKAYKPEAKFGGR